MSVGAYTLDFYLHLVSKSDEVLVKERVVGVFITNIVICLSLVCRSCRF